MTLKRCASLLILAAALVFAGAAHADVIDIRKADNAVSLDLGASNLDYAETVDGATFDTEKGWMPTIHIGIGLLASDQAPIPNLYLHADGQASFGSTAYDGALCDQFGDCVPAQSTTVDHIFSTDIQAGRAFAWGDKVMLTPFAEIGYRYWDRNAKGTGGYPEHYQNWDAMGGVLAQYSPAARWVLSLSGAAGTSFGASLNSFGENFPLKNELTWRGQGKIGYRLTDRVELTTTVEYSKLGFGASPVDANGFFEPDSTTHQTTVLMGLAYHFF